MMGRRLHTYPGTQADVTYDASRCIHAARCVHGLPEVFDPHRKPWVEPDRAEDVQALMRVIRACPTGALQYEVAGSSEPPNEAASVTVSANGPLYLRGDLTIVDSDGETIDTGTRLALCRCGASAIKPFCDGSHEKVGFSDGNPVFDGDPVSDA